MIIAAMGLALLVAWTGCGLSRQLALRLELIDIPNGRSSHTVPTPRGGGVGIMLGLGAGMLLLALDLNWPTPYPCLFLIALILLVIGSVDDRRGLPVGLRFALYAPVAIGTAALLLWPAPLWIILLSGIYVLWLLNLYNFMDGIDGIAAAEAIFVALAAGGLAWLEGQVALTRFCLLLAAANGGFLIWNRAPAKLFMGDAGSIPIGFLLAALSLTGALPLYCWLILLATFIADASITLCWRAVTGQRVTEAHHLHIYQRLSRHWNSHSKVVRALTLYNVAWLLPLAWLALQIPQWMPPALLAAYLPLLLLWLKAVKLP